MTDGDLVVSCTAVYLFSVIKHIHSEVFWSHSLNMRKFLSSLKKFDVDSCSCVVSWRNDNLLLEDDSILGWDICIDILLWFARGDLGESKRLLVAKGINDHLSISGVVWHDSLYDKVVSSIPVWL